MADGATGTLQQPATRLHLRPEVGARRQAQVPLRAALVPPDEEGPTSGSVAPERPPTPKRAAQARKPRPKAQKPPGGPETGRRRGAGLPPCGFSFGGQTCTRKGDHRCVLRVRKIQEFFERFLVHTKGTWARKPFTLEDWQLKRIIQPLFGQVVWSDEWSMYVRQYQILWLFVARKNGKSELLAGIALYLLCADDEQAAEIYGAAVDRDQARKVFDVAVRMVELSPELSKRLDVIKHVKRIIHPESGSVYEVVAADAAGNLGHNPHGVVFDEIVAQPNRELWDAFRTALGAARAQPMMVAATTAGPVNIASFAKHEHDAMRKIELQPDLAPHVLVVNYECTHEESQHWQDERMWHKANPALGTFLSLQALRNEAAEATNDPTKLNAFLAFHLNIWTQQITRCLDMVAWDNCNFGPINEQELYGSWCYGGLDLSATTDLTALCWYFPQEDAPDQMIWRAWVPEAKVQKLDEHTAGNFSLWVDQGWVTATDGEVIDYDEILAQIVHDATNFDVVEMALDKWNATHVLTRLNDMDIVAYEVAQTMLGMSPATKEFLARVMERRIDHGGNPVARWNADALEVKQDNEENIRPVKPNRGITGVRIDLMVAGILAIAADLRPKEDEGHVDAWMA